VNTPLYMVFDCESVGLHGETFAVGWVVVDGGGHEQASGWYSCPPDAAAGSAGGRAWVAANVPDLGATHASPREVRHEFWGLWRQWAGRGAVLAADVPWPVEARFLAACVDDLRGPARAFAGRAADVPPGPREWEGPYPLIDVASVRLAAGLDPLAEVDRRPDELPAHDPLCDARQSARLLVEALAVLRRGPPP
jgi:hypothetical protein